MALTRKYVFALSIAASLDSPDGVMRERMPVAARLWTRSSGSEVVLLKARAGTTQLGSLRSLYASSPIAIETRM